MLRKQKYESPANIAKLLAYDPETGIFTWKVKRRGSPHGWKPIGTVAGSIWPDGYRVINVNGIRYRASWIAVVLMTGRWPTKQVDHKNRTKDDDRWKNLRTATNGQNQANRGACKNNKLGVKGVCFEADRNRYKATIEIKGRSINLGRFKTISEARLAYLAAATKYFGEFAGG